MKFNWRMAFAAIAAALSVICFIFCVLLMVLRGFGASVPFVVGMSVLLGVAIGLLYGD